MTNPRQPSPEAASTGSTTRGPAAASAAPLADPRAEAHSRIEQLAGELSQPRLARVGPLLQRLVAAGSPLDDPAWRALADGLGRGFLDDFAVAVAQLQELTLRHKADKAALQAFGPLYQAITRQPLSAYPGLSEAIARAGAPVGNGGVGNGGVGSGGDRNGGEEIAGPIMSQLFVVALHRRLQLLYQVYLAGRPFPAEAGQDQRMRHLQPLEGLARRLLAACEPDRLVAWLGTAGVGTGGPRERIGTLAMALNKYAFEPYRVNFRFTHHCNIQCAHCYNFSGPHMKRERIDIERMVAIVADMPKTGMANMNLTGGEPFMYLDTVVALVAAARAAGVPEISMYTNGYFGRSEAQCRDVLGRLREAGFMNEVGRAADHIKVSAGVYHQEFLKFDTVITLIRVYHELFGKNVVVDYEALENWREVQAEIRSTLREAGVADLVDIHFRQITPVGRGAQFEAKMSHQPAESFPACGFIDEIVFDPDGSVRPCCGMNFGNDGIAVGSIHDDGLETLLLRTQNNPILQFIARNPIARLFEHLGRAPAGEGYADICNVCFDAVGNIEGNEDLKRRLAPRQDHFPFWWTAEMLASAG